MTVLQLAAAQLADVPLPAGALVIDDWMGPAVDDPQSIRYFAGTPRVVERDDTHADIEVLINGMQSDDGRVKREIVVDRDYDNALTIQQALDLSRALSDAALEAEDLAAHDPVNIDTSHKALLTAHDNAIECHAHIALAASGLHGSRLTRAVQLTQELHQALDRIGMLIDSITDEDEPEAS